MSIVTGIANWLRREPAIKGTRHRLTAVRIPALIALIVVAGCGPVAPGDVPSATSSASTSPITLDEMYVTCDQWTSLGENDRTTLENDSTYRTGTTLTVFLDDGALLTTANRGVSAWMSDHTYGKYSEFFDWACGRFPSATTLASVRSQLFSNPTNAPRTCAEYLDRDEAVQDSWRQVAIFVTVSSGGGEVSAGTMQSACEAQPDAVFLDVYSEASYGASNAVRWRTTSQLGYAFDNVLIAFGPSKTAPTYPLSDSLVVGAACGFDATTDAVVRVQLRTTNATAGYDAELQSSWKLRVGDTETVTAVVEANFSDGPSCISASGSSNDVNVGISWGEPVSPNASRIMNFYVILRNYYSPRYPSGSAGDLRRISIEGAAYSSPDDPVVTLKSEKRSLDGKKIG